MMAEEGLEEVAPVAYEAWRSTFPGNAPLPPPWADLDRNQRRVWLVVAAAVLAAAVLGAAERAPGNGGYDN